MTVRIPDSVVTGSGTANNVTALQLNCDSDLSRRWTIGVKL